MNALSASLDRKLMFIEVKTIFTSIMDPLLKREHAWQYCIA